MAMVKTLSIVIPAYNEEAYIGEIIARVIGVHLGKIKGMGERDRQ